MAPKQTNLDAIAQSTPSASKVAQEIASSVPGMEWIADYPIAVTGFAVGVLLLVVGITHLVTRQFILKAIVTFAKKSPITWDDLLVQHGVFHRLVAIPPVLVVQWGVVFVPGLSAGVVHFFQVIAFCVTTVLVARSFSAFLGAMNDFYRRFPAFSGRPIKGYVQVVQVLTYLFAAILVVAALLDQSPIFFLSGLGAMTAVLLLVFRDTLLSLVAGIQLSSNDLIRIGDWIEMPNFQADGDVVDIALNVVKVQNWDRTFTVIPTHKFLEYSFKNWRGMFDAGGRRIMRSIHIDVSTIRFLTPDEISRLRRIVVLKDYIDEKTREIMEHNQSRVPAELKDVMANQRALTNVGTFRAYITHYLRNHPGVHPDMLLLIRQLQPTPQGLPIQLYLFTSDTRWVQYEGIQADIFDHLFAIMPEFGLRAFQEPSGADISALMERRSLAAVDAVAVPEVRPHRPSVPAVP